MTNIFKNPEQFKSMREVIDETKRQLKGQDLIELGSPRLPLLLQMGMATFERFDIVDQLLVMSMMIGELLFHQMDTSSLSTFEQMRNVMITPEESLELVTAWIVLSRDAALEASKHPDCPKRPGDRMM